MKIFIICNLLHVVPSIIAVEIHEKHTREPPIAATRWKMEERLPPCAEFSYVVENLFVRRVRMRREGVRNSRRRLETRERETRAPRRMPRDWLPTDAGRRLWIGAVGGSSRWNGGEGIRRGGNDQSTYVASRGGRCPWDPMDTGNRWEYTRREYIQGESFRVSMREEKFEELAFAIFTEEDGLRIWVRI